MMFGRMEIVGDVRHFIFFMHYIKQCQLVIKSLQKMINGYEGGF